jgi:hypothetical protein
MSRLYYPKRPNPRKIISLLIDPHDLGALEPKAGHQTLLIEGESVDAAMQCVGREAASHSFVHDNNAGTGANFPAARVVYSIHRILVHQKEGVAVFGRLLCKP